MRVIHRKRRPREERRTRSVQKVPRRSLSDACFRLLERVRGGGVTDEDRRAWEAVWGGPLQPEHVCGLPIAEADLAVFAGWSLAMGEEHWDDAVRLERALLRHPEMGGVDRVSLLTHRCHLAASLLAAGRLDEACDEMRALLALRSRTDSRMAALAARADLVAFCARRPAAVPAPEALADLARLVASRVGRRRRAEKLPAHGLSFGDLHALLAPTTRESS